MVMQGNGGTNALVKSLVDLIYEHGPRAVQWTEIGEIQDDMGLRPASFAASYPRNSYYVTERLLSADPIATSSEETVSGTTDPGGGDSHTHTITADGAHTHTIAKKGVFRPLQPGDKVLIAWISENIPVVIDRIHFSDALIDSERV